MLYEIIEAENGDVILQREGDAGGEPLVVMRFSEELMRHFKDSKIDIAKIMIEAGLEHIAKLAEEQSEKLGLPRKKLDPIIIERQDDDQEDEDQQEEELEESEETNHLVH